MSFTDRLKELTDKIMGMVQKTTEIKSGHIEHITRIKGKLNVIREFIASVQLIREQNNKLTQDLQLSAQNIQNSAKQLADTKQEYDAEKAAAQLAIEQERNSKNEIIQQKDQITQESQQHIQEKQAEIERLQQELNGHIDAVQGVAQGIEANMAAIDENGTTVTDALNELEQDIEDLHVQQEEAPQANAVQEEAPQEENVEPQEENVEPQEVNVEPEEVNAEAKEDTPLDIAPNNVIAPNEPVVDNAPNQTAPVVAPAPIAAAQPNRNKNARQNYITTLQTKMKNKDYLNETKRNAGARQFTKENAIESLRQYDTENNITKTGNYDDIFRMRGGTTRKRRRGGKTKKSNK